jgi:hypothetical protein
MAVLNLAIALRGVRVAGEGQRAWIVDRQVAGARVSCFRSRLPPGRADAS